MAKTKASLFIEACESGNIEIIRQIRDGRFKLSSKSTVKAFNNRFEQALSASSKTNKEEDVVTEICLFEEDINELISESMILSLVSSSRINILKVLVNNGLDLGRNSEQLKYKTIFDRLFRNALFSRNIESMEYLLTIFEYNWIHGSKLCKSICEPESNTIIDSLNYRLQDRIDGFKTIYDILFRSALLNKDIEGLKALLPNITAYNIDIESFVRLIVFDVCITEIAENKLKEEGILVNSTNTVFTNFYDLLLNLGVTTDDIVRIVNS